MWPLREAKHWYAPEWNFCAAVICSVSLCCPWIEMCWSGTMGSVFRYQVTVNSGEPSTVQVKNSVLLMPVFRFLGDKVTRSGSVKRTNVRVTA